MTEGRFQGGHSISLSQFIIYATTTVRATEGAYSLGSRNRDGLGNALCYLGRASGSRSENIFDSACYIVTERIMRTQGGARVRVGARGVGSGTGRRPDAAGGWTRADEGGTSAGGIL